MTHIDVEITNCSAYLKLTLIISLVTRSSVCVFPIWEDTNGSAQLQLRLKVLYCLNVIADG